MRCFGPAGLHGECTQSSWAAREPPQSNELESMLTDTQSVVTISAFRTRSRPMVPGEASNLGTGERERAGPAICARVRG